MGCLSSLWKQYVLQEDMSQSIDLRGEELVYKQTWTQQVRRMGEKCSPSRISSTHLSFYT